MSVSPRLLLFYRVFVFFSAMGVQKHYKNILQKNRAEKFVKKCTANVFTKNRAEKGVFR
jgi:hypothetical protein